MRWAILCVLLCAAGVRAQEEPTPFWMPPPPAKPKKKKPVQVEPLEIKEKPPAAERRKPPAQKPSAKPPSGPEPTWIEPPTRSVPSTRAPTLPAAPAQPPAEPPSPAPSLAPRPEPSPIVAEPTPIILLEPEPSSASDLRRSIADPEVLESLASVPLTRDEGPSTVREGAASERNSAQSARNPYQSQRRRIGMPPDDESDRDIAHRLAAELGRLSGPHPRWAEPPSAAPVVDRLGRQAWVLGGVLVVIGSVLLGALITSVGADRMNRSHPHPRHRPQTSPRPSTGRSASRR